MAPRARKNGNTSSESATKKRKIDSGSQADPNSPLSMPPLTDDGSDDGNTRIEAHKIEPATSSSSGTVEPAINSSNGNVAVSENPGGCVEPVVSSDAADVQKSLPSPSLAVRNVAQDVLKQHIKVDKDIIRTLIVEREESWKEEMERRDRHWKARLDELQRRLLSVEKQHQLEIEDYEEAHQELLRKAKETDSEIFTLSCSWDELYDKSERTRMQNDRLKEKNLNLEMARSDLSEEKDRLMIKTEESIAFMSQTKTLETMEASLADICSTKEKMEVGMKEFEKGQEALKGMLDAFLLFIENS
ncbi:MAG: hypothetical protein Q9227_006028 [Pyrenula ochraceoflavens]